MLTRRHLGRRLGLTAAMVVLAVLGVASPASAHAQLDTTNPVASSVLTESPSQVVLHFDQAVETDFGSIKVLGPQGQRVDEGNAHHPGADTSTVVVSLPQSLPDGTYVVAWHVISADSHPVHGAFYFSVGTSKGAAHARAVAGSLANANGPVAVGVVYWFARAATFASLLLLVGLAAMVVVARPPLVVLRRVRRTLVWSWVALAFLTVAAIALQGVYAAQLPLSDIVRPSLFNEVLGTHFGRVELLRLVLLAVAAVVGWMVVSAAGRDVRPRWWWLVLGVVVGELLLATAGLAGHASTGRAPLLGMTLDLVHLSAASLWVGGLVLLVIVLWRHGEVAVPTADAWPVALRVSDVSLVAVIAIVASGTVQAIRQIGSFYALFNTAYGWTLIAKVCLVAVVVAVAAVFSRRIVHGNLAVPFVARRGRRSRSDRMSAVQRADAGADAANAGVPASATGASVGPGAAVAEAGAGSAERVARRRLLRSVLAELAILIGVLGVTAALVNDVPAGVAASLPYSQTFDVLGVQVNAIVSPARPGAGNEFHFYVLGPDGQPHAIPELDVSIALPSQGLGPISVPVEVVGPGHYQNNNVTIPFAGDWELDLTVRTSAIDEQEVRGVIPVH